MLEMSGDVDILGDVTLALRAVRRPSPRWSSVYSLGLYDVRHPMADFRRHRPAPYHSPPVSPPTRRPGDVSPTWRRDRTIEERDRTINELRHAPQEQSPREC